MNSWKKYDLLKFEKFIFVLDKIFGSILPTLIFCMIAYAVEGNRYILAAGFIFTIAMGTFVWLGVIKPAKTIKQWEKVKIGHFVLIYLIVVISSLSFKFLEKEYLLFVALSLAVLTIFPFRKMVTNVVFFSIFILTGFLLFMNEHFFTGNSIAGYEQFNVFFLIGIMYITLLNIALSFIRVRFNLFKLKENQNYLNRSELLYRNVFDNSHSAIGIYSLSSKRLIACNDKSVETFNYSNKKELLNSPLIDFIAPKQFSEISGEIFLENTKKELFENGSFSGRFKAQKENKDVFIADVNLVIDYKLDSDQVIFFISDLTEEFESRKTISMQLELLDEKNTELEKYIESNLQLENFAHLASHDLKAPLNTINSFSGLLKELAEDKLDEVEKQFLEYIIKGSNNMQNTINSLLNFSMASNKKIELEWISPKAVIQELIETINADLKQSKTRIEIIGCQESIYADKTLFKELFQNLILNSSKFVQPNSTPHILIESTVKKNVVKFSISDNGIGIPDEFKEKVFLIFQRLHNKEQYHGTGMGLAISRKIVEMHGGRIWIEDHNLPGTKVSFTITKYQNKNLKTSKRKIEYA